MIPRSNGSLYVRNAIFGIEDSLAATVGMLSGLAVEAISHQQLILTGLIYIFVEAFSMAVGSFLSEESAEEYDQRKTSVVTTIIASVIMFISCVVAGFVPILPYFFIEGTGALPTSICLSVVVLAIVGGVQGVVSKKSVLPRVLRMAFLGGAAIAVGIVVGKLFGLS